MTRKHYTQFNKKEKSLLGDIRKQLVIDKFSKHARKRINEKYSLQSFRKSDYMEAMLYGQIIEVADYGNDDVRIVFRSLTSRNNDHLVFSYSIKNRTVVTAWTNDKNDNHSTIDYSEYNYKMDVNKVLTKAMRIYRRKDKKIRKKEVQLSR